MAQIVCDHNEINPVERMKKMLDDKEVTLVKGAKEVKRWMKKKADA